MVEFIPLLNWQSETASTFVRNYVAIFEGIPYFLRANVSRNIHNGREIFQIYFSFCNGSLMGTRTIEYESKKYRSQERAVKQAEIDLPKIVGTALIAFGHVHGFQIDAVQNLNAFERFCRTLSTGNRLNVIRLTRILSYIRSVYDAQISHQPRPECYTSQELPEAEIEPQEPQQTRIAESAAIEPSFGFNVNPISPNLTIDGYVLYLSNPVDWEHERRQHVNNAMDLRSRTDNPVTRQHYEHFIRALGYANNRSQMNNALRRYSPGFYSYTQMPLEQTASENNPFACTLRTEMPTGYAADEINEVRRSIEEIVSSARTPERLRHELIARNREIFELMAGGAVNRALRLAQQARSYLNETAQYSTVTASQRARLAIDKKQEARAAAIRLQIEYEQRHNVTPAEMGAVSALMRRIEQTNVSLDDAFYISLEIIATCNEIFQRINNPVQNTEDLLQRRNGPRVVEVEQTAIRVNRIPIDPAEFRRQFNDEIREVENRVAELGRAESEAREQRIRRLRADAEDAEILRRRTNAQQISEQLNEISQIVSSRQSTIANIAQNIVNDISNETENAETEPTV